MSNGSTCWADSSTNTAERPNRRRGFRNATRQFDPPATAAHFSATTAVASNIKRTLGPDTTGTGLPTASRQPDTISPTRPCAAAPPDGHQFACRLEGRAAASTPPAPSAV